MGPGQGMFHVGPPSASGQERRSPDVTEARGQPKGDFIATRARVFTGPFPPPLPPFHCVSTVSCGC